jgi:hypothetical protein
MWSTSPCLELQREWHSLKPMSLLLGQGKQVWDSLVHELGPGEPILRGKWFPEWEGNLSLCRP